MKKGLQEAVSVRGARGHPVHLQQCPGRGVSGGRRGQASRGSACGRVVSQGEVR